MIRIIHAADLHLDSPFSALPPDKARQRRRESREIPNRLADLAIRRQADLVLLAGDLFDGARVYPETLEMLRAALERMPCPVVIAPGNHDPYTPGCPYDRVQWPENVHIFRESGLKALRFPALGCTVYGAAFTQELRAHMALERAFPEEGSGLRLLCLHGETDRPESRYGPILTRQLSAWGFHYAALGHIHRCSGLQRSGNTFWAYPGCPEGRGFDETGEKGVLAVTVDGSETEAEFVPLGARQYRILPVDVTGRDVLAALRGALPETGDICRLVLTGERADAIDLDALQRELAPYCFGLQLRDETRIGEDIWKETQADSLRGLFLRRLRQQYDAAADEETKEKIALAVRFGLAALEGRDLG